MPQQPVTSFADDLAKARAAFDADLMKARGPKPVASHASTQDLPSLDDYGRDVLNEPKESLDAAKPFIAPALSGIAAGMSGGSSIPIQMLAQGASGAAGSAVRGGSPAEMAGNAALDAGTAGVGGLVAKGAGNAMRLSKPVVKLVAGATERAPGKAASIASRMLPLGIGRNIGAAGEMMGGTADDMNRAIYRGAQGTQAGARSLPQVSELIRALLLEKLGAK